MDNDTKDAKEIALAVMSGGFAFALGVITDAVLAANTSGLEPKEYSRMRMLVYTETADTILREVCSKVGLTDEQMLIMDEFFGEYSMKIGGVKVDESEIRSN